MARWAALIEKRRTRHPAVIVDAGSFCNPKQGRSVEFDLDYFFEGMKLMDYDAVGVGPHDIRFGRKRLLERVDEAGFELLSTNLIDKRGDGTLGGKYEVVKAGGVRIGFFSVILPLLVHEIDPEIPKFYEVVDPRMAALEAVSVLREKGCDLVVALGYLGWKGSKELAESVDGIDVVINGKREHNRPTGEMVGGTMVVDTGMRSITFTEVLAEWTGGVPRLRVKEAGGEAKRLDGREDLLELERRYTEELRARGIKDAREGS
jgi:2',3'-cyclic-nucleotide 2'-phosphodiesterase (5'-nucleotidase family)